MTRTPRVAPVLQVRVIGAPHQTDPLLTALTQHARDLLGPGVTCRTQTRDARRPGYVRVYLTITRKESPHAARTTG